MKRRDFLKLGAAGVATLVLGPRLPGFGIKDAFAASQTLDVVITDARKDMVTHNAINTAQCYFWIYQMTADGVPVPPDCPGPTICAVKGDSITINITNNLDEPHSFYIPGIFDSGPIAPNGGTYSGTLTASVSGAHMYYDNLNEPVNRVMGLHGGLVVRPAAAAVGHKFTPYDNPGTHVQALYDDFGGTEHFPGLAWEEGDPATLTPPFRQYVWLLHQASPNLFAEVGNYTPGQNYPAADFLEKFLRDPFSPTRANNLPQYFTINGQSGFFSHSSPTITPCGRIGEPVILHIMNAGIWTHSMHYHCNHFYVTSVNGVPSPNPIWVDLYNLNPMDRVDYTLPFMRPPNVPNTRGIGLPDPGLIGINGNPCWPPVEEFGLHFPALGTTAKDINGNDVELGQRQSPLNYPMHDHCEPSQTSQGGNYNCGLIAGMTLTGDRNTPGYMDFPMDEDFAMMFRNIRGVSATGPAPGTAPQ